MAFLNVEKSATLRAWQDRLSPADKLHALAIEQQLEIPEMLARVLASRGLTAQTANDFLHPTFKALMPDPTVLQDMEKAVTRLVKAVENGEQVAIFGDYDVDGATSSAVLALFLRGCGLNPFIHIPDRLTEGYGPNAEAIEHLKARGATLLVTVDCGTTSHKILGEAQQNGLDVVVIDHHQADEILPEVTALVNPKRLDDLSNLDNLAACGVVFMVCVGVNRALKEKGFYKTTPPDLFALTDCVGLGTVADMVALTGLNRAFVRHGLTRMKERHSVGISALMDAARVTEAPSPYHLGFVLGPRINAGGRIGDAALGARLLTLNDPLEAKQIAEELNRLNQERQLIEQEALRDAEREAHLSVGIDESKGGVLVTASDAWHPGVVGLIASRLKERFKRPAFAITFERGEIGSGSGRSINGIDLGKIIREAVTEGLLLKGGGHAMAAGLTIEKAKLGAFRAFLDEKLEAAVKEQRASDVLHIDGALTARGASVSFVKLMNSASPFGTGNPEPIFAFPNHTLIFADSVGEAHVKCRLKSGDGAILNAICFRALNQPLGDFLMKNRGKEVHIAGTLSVDTWQGQERVQLRIVDAG